MFATLDWILEGEANDDCSGIAFFRSTKDLVNSLATLGFVSAICLAQVVLTVGSFSARISWANLACVCARKVSFRIS